MTYSRINKWEYNQKKWIISLVNTEKNSLNKLFGHAVIVVEGILEDGSAFIGEYDIRASGFQEEQSILQGAMGNIQGYITKIRCNPQQFSHPHEKYSKEIDEKDHPKYEGAYRDYTYNNYSSKSWYVSPEAAIEMILSIEIDADILDTEIKSADSEKRNVEWPFKYQKAGSYRWSIFGSNEGHNCLTWAEEKLAIAGAGNQRLLTDSSKASTEIHVRCSIQ